MILTREQVDDIRDGGYPAAYGDMGPLVQTAYAYHDLRDTMLGLCDLADPPGLRAGLPTVTVAALRSAILALDEEEKS